MMRNLKYTATLAAAALLAALPVACTDDPAEPAEPTEPTEQGSDLPVCWEVKGVSSPSDASRVMVGDDNDADGKPITAHSVTNPAHRDFNVFLKEVCSAPLNDDGTTYDREGRFAIGLFGDYTYKENNQEKTEYDFYRGDRLVYLPGAPQDQTPTGWDTNAGMKYWHPGAKYIFRAYYPQRLYNYTIQTSNASSLSLVYPSRKLQYDLLLAVKEVDTTLDTWSGSAPVDLQFQHALAALRFQFKLNFVDADFLTSVYLINDEDRHYFSQGTVVFGDEIKTGDSEDVKKEKRKRITWLQDYNPPAYELLYKWVPPLKYWYGLGEDKDNDGIVEKEECVEMSAEEMLKHWGYPDDVYKTDEVDADLELRTAMPKTDYSKTYNPSHPHYNPVLMYSVVPEPSGNPTDDGGTEYIYHGKVAEAYYGTELYYDVDHKKWVARTPAANNAHEVDDYRSGEADEVAAEGTLYCRNSGWLLIPPQESFGTLTLCFTTKKGGKTLYKVKLPQNTGSKIDVVDEDGNTVEKDGWAAGKRYTYEVSISQSNLAVNVSIQDWNERKHSTEIIF